MGQSLLLAAVTVTVKFMLVVVHSKQSSGKIIINILLLWLVLLDNVGFMLNSARNPLD